MSLDRKALGRGDRLMARPGETRAGELVVRPILERGRAMSVPQPAPFVAGEWRGSASITPERTLPDRRRIVGETAARPQLLRRAGSPMRRPLMRQRSMGED